MHPNWESHVNEETNSGVFFSLFNVHMSCIMSTFILCLCIMVCILLGYLGYCRFCHCPKRKSREALRLQVHHLRLLSRLVLGLLRWRTNTKWTITVDPCTSSHRNAMESSISHSIIDNSSHVMPHSSNVMTTINVIMVAHSWILLSNCVYFCRPFR
jgi:hypothetical protein